MIPPLIIDSFAGGGGASTGIELALGRSPDVAINHSASALALHAVNHPETLHLDSNIWDVEPREVTKGRPVGLLWASPDCKHFSKAKGGAPRDRNIRDLAWVIVKWAEDVRPDVILMENVEEFTTWGPVDNEGQPIKEFSGQTFDDWKLRLCRAGYKLQHRELRACDFGAPTIRKRFFLIARRDGRLIVWPKPTHGDPKSDAVKRGKLLPWRTAAECIDWSLPCPSIFDTKDQVFAKHGLRAVRPLAANTLARVARGMKRYVLEAERPFLVNLTHGARTEDLAEPFKTITGAHRGEKAVIAPSITRFNGGATGQDLREPMATVTANSWIKRPGGAAPLGIIAPSLVSIAHGYSGGRREYPLTDPLGTVTVGGIQHAVVAPSLLSLKGTDRRAMPADAPHPTVLAGGGHSALISAVLTYAQQGGGNRSIEDPHHTICASRKDQNAVIVPHMMTMRNAGKPFNGADEPMHTITAGGAGLTTVVASIMGCGGRAAQSRPRGMAEPMATVTGKADACIAAAFLAQHHTGVTGHDARDPMSTIAATGSHQMPVQATVAPWFAKYYGAGTGARTDEPAHTITVNDRFAHVEASIQAPPFGEEHHARAHEVAEFLRSQGAWDGGEFVTLTIADQTFVIVDIGMRMLIPRELFNAQGFPRDYAIDGHWVEASGDWTWKSFPKDVQVSCCGNSVCPNLSRALVAANCQHLMKMEQVA
ncbi:MAG: DNA cytosine methyltransferase [Cypionkella sp.]